MPKDTAEKSGRNLLSKEDLSKLPDAVTLVRSESGLYKAFRLKFADGGIELVAITDSPDLQAIVMSRAINNLLDIARTGQRV